MHKNRSNQNRIERASIRGSSYYYFVIKKRKQNRKNREHECQRVNSFIINKRKQVDKVEIEQRTQCFQHDQNFAEKRVEHNCLH